MEDDSDDASKFLASIGISSDPLITRPANIVINEEEPTDLIPLEEKDVDESVTSDFTLARQNILDATDKLKEAMTELLPIAKQSQHPRAFEVFASLGKVVLDAQQDLLNLHKKKEELKPGSAKQDDASSSTTNIQNNIFTGSTAELQKLFTQIGKS